MWRNLHDCLQLQAEVVQGKMVECRPVKAPQKCTLPSCPSVSSEDGELPPQVEYKWFRKTRTQKKTVMHLSIVSGTVGKTGNPREIDQAKSPLGQRFDRQLHPASGEIDNPRENWPLLRTCEFTRIASLHGTLKHSSARGVRQPRFSLVSILENNRLLLVTLKMRLTNLKR